MIITKLEIENFRTVSSYTEYEFEEGINIILAKNGRGKSTMLKALRLLIVGLTDATNLAEWINFNTKEDFYDLACEFNHEGFSYRSEFHLELVGKSTKTNRKLFINGNLEVEGSSTVLSKLAEIFDPQLTDNSLFLMQNTNQIVDVTNAERREIIKKMKNIDYSTKVKKDIDPKIEKTKKDVIEVDKKIFSLEHKSYDPKIAKPLPFLKTKYDELVEESKNLSEELTLINNKKAEKENKEKELKTTIETIDSNKKIIEENSKKEQETTESLKTTKHTRDTEKSSTDAIINKLEEESTKLSTAFGLEEEKLTKSYKDQSSVIENDIKKLTEELDKYPVKRIAKFDESTIDHYTKEISNIEAEITSLKKSIESMENGKCPTCGRDYEATTIDEYRENLQFKESALFEAKSFLDDEKVKKAEYENKVETNSANREKKVELTNKISTLKTKLETIASTYEKDIKNTKDKIDKEISVNKYSLKMNKDKLESIESVYESKSTSLNLTLENLQTKSKELTETNESLTTKKITLEKEIASYNLDGIKEIEVNLNKVKSKIKEYDDILVENKTIKTFNEELVTKEKEDKKELKSLIKDRDKLKSNQLNLEQAKNILLKDLPNYIISQDLQGLESSMNEMIDRVYTKSLNIGFKQNKSSILLNYGSSKSKRNCRGGLSGAESALATIAFTSTFNKNLGLGCLLADEPDASMDSENAESLYEFLGNMEDDFNQLFFITHKESMQSYLEKHYNPNVIRL